MNSFNVTAKNCHCWLFVDTVLMLVIDADDECNEKLTV